MLIFYLPNDLKLCIIWSMKKKQIHKAFKGVVTIKRSAIERGTLALSWNHISKKAPAGDGHPVLVFPGFLTNDTFIAPLRDCIAEKGYKVYGWDGGFNIGLDKKSGQQMRAHLKQIFDENGGQKITLIGHSLGGIFARELAREFPDVVRDVITLGTPFGGMADKTATPGYLGDLYGQLNPATAHLLKSDKMTDRLLTPPPVPTTSIFSKTDETVDWRACLNPILPQTENIQIRASHAGMPFNPTAINVILDRLGQKEGAWQPFAPKASAVNNIFYPAGSEEKLAAPKNPGWDPAKLKTQAFFKKSGLK